MVIVVTFSNLFFLKFFPRCGFNFLIYMLHFLPSRPATYYYTIFFTSVSYPVVSSLHSTLEVCQAWKNPSYFESRCRSPGFIYTSLWFCYYLCLLLFVSLLQLILRSFTSSFHYYLHL